MPKAVVVILGCALVFLAGCATSTEPPPSEWSAAHETVQVTNQFPFKSVPVAVRTNQITAPRTNRPASSVNTATSDLSLRVPPVYTWTSLSRWAAERKLNPPVLMAKAPLVTYSISSAHGVMVLAIGSRDAMWNGLTVRLGYTPEMIDGEIYVHGLDLEKSLAPFLCEPTPIFRNSRVIVIDPGHGGVNGGTTSVIDRRPEKEFTLDWARRLKPLLEQEGWTVFLTRNDDQDVALSNRVTVADNHHADLFISLHFNSLSPDQTPAGLATFCIPPMGMPSTISRGYQDVIYQGFPNNNFDAQNIQLAERLQRSLLRATGMEDRGVNRARFMGVLRTQQRPAVLIEAGFLSNPREARRIESPDFRQKLAEAVATALK